MLQIESQVRVLTSDSVLRRVIKTEELDRDPEFVSQSSWFGSANDSTVAALNALRRSIVVKRAERTYVVDVAVSSRDPAKAARIANAIAQAYLAEQTDVRSDAARQVSQSLSARLKELADRVRAAEERVEAFKAHNNIISANGQLVNEQQLSDLNKQLADARARTAEARGRLDQIESVQKSRGENGAFAAAVLSQTITALRAQYAEVLRREAEQKTSLGDRHPAVIEIEAQAERLRRMIEDEVGRIAIAGRAEYESAKASEEQIARNVDSLKQNALTTNEAMVTVREFEREAQANRTVYEAFLARARETGEQEGVDTKNIHVISRADLPQRRSFPPSNTVMALSALLIGIAAGTGIVLMRDTYGSRERRAYGGQSLFDGRLASAIQELWQSASGTSTIPVLAILPSADVSYGLSAAEDPQSRFAAEIRRVYEAVCAGRPASAHPSILVVAPDAGDDTVTVALALAAVIATSQRVLLIDADLERRTLLAIDADRNEAGLVDVATGRRALADVVIRDPETNINLVPFVSQGSRRDGRISEADVRHAFDQTKRFDTVIVAALDLRRNPGTSFFAGLVDHIVLVAREEDAESGAVDAFVARLGREGSKVRGAVLTSARAA